MNVLSFFLLLKGSEAFNKCFLNKNAFSLNHTHSMKNDYNIRYHLKDKNLHCYAVNYSYLISVDNRAQ